MPLLHLSSLLLLDCLKSGSVSHLDANVMPTPPSPGPTLSVLVYVPAQRTQDLPLLLNDTKDKGATRELDLGFLSTHPCPLPRTFILLSMLQVGSRGAPSKMFLDRKWRRRPLYMSTSLSAATQRGGSGSLSRSAPAASACLLSPPHLGLEGWASLFLKPCFVVYLSQPIVKY